MPPADCSDSDPMMPDDELAVVTGGCVDFSDSCCSASSLSDECEAFGSSRSEDSAGLSSAPSLAFGCTFS
jgi:hypothetical protein